MSWKRILATAGTGLVALALAAYAADYGYLRYRVARKRNPFSTITVYWYYAVAEKNSRVEYVFDRVEPQTCAESLFPQLGYEPCWYLSRHTQKQIKI